MQPSIPAHLQGKLDQAISEVIKKGPKCSWSFGGGSALECWIGHRKSEDIDIFLNDTQLLPYFSPRLGNITLTDTYKESHLTLKLYMLDHQIDLIVSHPLLDDPYYNLNGMFIETPSEIIAKKVHYRSEAFKQRDFFDLAACIHTDIEFDSGCKQMIADKKRVLLERLKILSPTLKESGFKDQLNVYPKFQNIIENVEDIVCDYLKKSNA